MTQQLFDAGYEFGRNTRHDSFDFSNMHSVYKAGLLVGLGEARAVVGGSPAMHVSHLLRYANVSPGDFRGYVTDHALEEFTAAIEQAE